MEPITAARPDDGVDEEYIVELSATVLTIESGLLEVVAADDREKK